MIRSNPVTSPARSREAVVAVRAARPPAPPTTTCQQTRAARSPFVQQRAEAEDVAPRVGWFSRRLLRRHVRERAHHAPGAALATTSASRRRGRPRGRRAAQLRQAEVEHLDGAVLPDHDVGGLEVAMDDPVRVRGRQRVGHRDPDAERSPSRMPLTRISSSRLFRARTPSRGNRSRRSTRFIDRDDVRMVEGGGGLGFALEPPALLVGDPASWEYLDGDLAREAADRARDRPLPCRRPAAARESRTDRGGCRAAASSRSENPSRWTSYAAEVIVHVPLSISDRPEGVWWKGNPIIEPP